MNFAHIVAAYVNLNVLVIAGFVSLAIYPKLAGLAKRTIDSGTLLKLHYAVLSVLIPLLLSYPLLPERITSDPVVQIWSAQSMDTVTGDYSPREDDGYFVLSGTHEVESFDTGNARLAISGFIIFLLIWGGLGFSDDLRKLFTMRNGSYLIRKFGSVSIYANDGIKVPFSYWLPGRANVIIPTVLIGDWPNYKITILHELQHHRNGDTKWLYFLWFLRSICILNPCIHLWHRVVSELQEFACDEMLIGRKRIDPRDYARCLYEAGLSASDRRFAPFCAAGLILMAQRRLLKRRIENMLGKMPNRLKWWINPGVALLIVGLMVSISFASKGVLQDRRITEAQAIAMAERAGEDTEFPVVVNDLVLKELNAYLGTPEGREFVKASLERMKNYREGIEEKIKEYGVPTEFLAIPLVESGYRNLEQKEWWGAGLWMFIQSTARSFGLTVNDQVDERLDIDMLTDAAMRYLLANKLRFNDWQLAVLAYNVGESNVQKAIEKIGTRDVWDLSRTFYKNGNNYYAKFMAAVFILKNPDFVAQKLITASEDVRITFISPISGWISSRFGYRNSPFTKKKEFHEGLDISASKGNPIRAAASGTVTKVEFTEARGHQITLRHGNNYQTHYAQCEKILAREGQVVKSGDLIATCGGSGRSTGPHLHFELRRYGEAINPEQYIAFR